MSIESAGRLGAATERVGISPYAGLIVATALWGALHPIGKLVMREATPVQLILARVVFAGLTLGLILALQGKVGLIAAEWRTRPGTLVILAGLSFLGSSGGSMVALSLLPASVSSLLSNTSPLFVAIGAILASRGRPSAWTILGILIGFLGLGLVVFGENPGSFGTLAVDPRGVALSLASSLCWAGYIGAGRRAMVEGNPLAVVAACSIVGAIPWLLVAGVDGGLVGLARLSAETWGLLLFVGVIGTGVTYGLWTAALTRLSASNVAVFQYAIPFWSIVLAVLLLGEPITLPLVLGGIGIIAGIAITQRRPAAAPRRSSASEPSFRT